VYVWLCGEGKGVWVKRDDVMGWMRRRGDLPGGRGMGL
jgi:uncharacterized protein YegJ (DUF2314 family)